MAERINENRQYNLYDLTKLNAFSEISEECDNGRLCGNMAARFERGFAVNSGSRRYGWLLAPFSCLMRLVKGEKAAHNAVRTELLNALAGTFNLKKDRELGDRLQAILGADVIKWNDFAYNGSEATSGKPLTNKRIRQIITRACDVARDQQDDRAVARGPDLNVEVAPMGFLRELKSKLRNDLTFSSLLPISNGDKDHPAEGQMCDVTKSLLACAIFKNKTIRNYLSGTLNDQNDQNNINNINSKKEDSQENSDLEALNAFLECYSAVTDHVKRKFDTLPKNMDSNCFKSFLFEYCKHYNEFYAQKHLRNPDPRFDLSKAGDMKLFSDWKGKSFPNATIVIEEKEGRETIVSNDNDFGLSDVGNRNTVSSAFFNEMDGVGDKDIDATLTDFINTLNHKEQIMFRTVLRENFADWAANVKKIQNIKRFAVLYLLMENWKSISRWIKMNRSFPKNEDLIDIMFGFLPKERRDTRNAANLTERILIMFSTVLAFDTVERKHHVDVLRNVSSYSSKCNQNINLVRYRYSVGDLLQTTDGMDALVFDFVTGMNKTKDYTSAVKYATGNYDQIESGFLDSLFGVNDKEDWWSLPKKAEPEGINRKKWNMKISTGSKGPTVVSGDQFDQQFDRFAEGIPGSGRLKSFSRASLKKTPFAPHAEAAFVTEINLTDNRISLTVSEFGERWKYDVSGDMIEFDFPLYQEENDESRELYRQDRIFEYEFSDWQSTPNLKSVRIEDGKIITQQEFESAKKDFRWSLEIDVGNGGEVSGRESISENNIK